MVFVFLNFIFSFMYFRFLSPSVIHDPPKYFRPRSPFTISFTLDRLLCKFYARLSSPQTSHMCCSPVQLIRFYFGLSIPPPQLWQAGSVPLPWHTASPPPLPPGLALPISPRPGRCWFLLNSFSLYVSN